MSTRTPLVQVIENSTAQVRLTKLKVITLFYIYKEISFCDTSFIRFLLWLFSVSGCLCHTAVIHQRAHALPLDVPNRIIHLRLCLVCVSGHVVLLDFSGL